MDRNRRAKMALADMGSVDRKVTRPLSAFTRELATAMLRAYAGNGNPVDLIKAGRNRLVDLSVDAMVTAHLLGRRRIGLDLAGKTAPVIAMAGGFTGIYDSAVAFLRKRLSLSETDIRGLEAVYHPEAVRVVGKALRYQEQAVQDAIREVVQEGLHTQEGIARVRAAMQGVGLSADPHVYETIFRTQTAIAYSAGQQNALADPDVSDIVVGYSYATVGDDRVRPDHEAMEGVTADKDDPIWNVWTPPAGFNCFPCETICEGSIVGASKALYSGPMVSIETRRGHRLTVTPQHPILSRSGWVAAEDVREGCELFTKRGMVKVVDGPRTGTVAGNDNPAMRIDEVFEAMKARTGMFVVKVSALDFHGDAAWFKNRNVEVVGVYGELMLGRDTISAEQAGYDKLVTSNLAAVSMAGNRLSTSFVPCLGFVEFGERGIDDSPFSELGVFDKGSGYSDPMGFGQGSKSNVMALEKFGNSPAAFSEFFRELQDCRALDVSPDYVVRVRRVPLFHGHVLDLQSVTGMITANGITCHNCRCTLLPILSGDEFIKKSAPPGAAPDPGFDFNPGDLFRDTIKVAA